jgi:F-type H+-transporting ATPase subunit delta
MRGASRASLADASDQLSALATTKAIAETMGDELFAVARLLDTEHALRRTLTDPGRPAAAKEALVRSLLAGKVSAPTLDLLAGLVSARWSASRDLATAVEELAVKALTIAAERSRQLDDLEDELFRFGRVVNAEPDLRVALSSPFASDERKQELVDTLLRGKVTPPALRLITEAALHPRGRSLDASLEEFARMAAERRERLLAEVHVAIALTAEQRGRLAAALADTYGRDVHLNIVVDPQVIGGMSVRISDELIDGSMASRLAGLRRRLAA